ncbi:MAG: N-acetyl sugar amidotransferase [Oscillospiraceae bacterium]|nr:N-acetyl sugar amidotransferase [Oscillospiraceae bacterium]
MSEYQICKRCVMDNIGDPNIVFDENGFCNYCTTALALKPDCPENGDLSKVKALFDKIKEACKNDPYDCLVGVSGGLDSSYIIYLGHKFGLRMLGIHIDDGLDTELAKQNIKNLCEKAQVTLINLCPDPEQYRDLTLSFFKAGVPNLAIPQDNLILGALTKAVKDYHLKYLLHGSNYSMECILQEGNSYTAADDAHIRGIQKKFSGRPIDKLPLTTTFENSILKRLRKDVIRVKPLNLIDYRFDTALQELYEFCGYKYYGAKHHESVLTRFMQCWYLPEKFAADKRKSHLSSLVITGQITREEALDRLAQPKYPSEEMKQADFNTLASFLGISREEFDELISQPPHSHDEYPKSFLSNKLVPALLHIRNSFFKRKRG